MASFVRLKESADTVKKTVKFSKKKEDDELNLCPFKLLSAFGMNPNVPLINLTTQSKTIIAYACSHIVQIYDYESKGSIPLQGHQNAVMALSVSKDGKWLLTADFGKDSVVVVWDTEKAIPICTLFNPHGDKGMTAAGISTNAKYIVTVGNELIQRVNCWLWTYGKDEPDASVELSEINSDRVKKIIFNDDYPEEFILTTDHNVVFVSWEDAELKPYYPKVSGNVRKYGTFNSTCYVPEVEETLTATANGYVLVWHIIKKKHSKVKNEERKHAKTVKLQKAGINVILYHKRMIVTGTTEGRIDFYDLRLQVLYWCQNCGLDNIRSISFDLPFTSLVPLPVVSESESDLGGEEGEEYEEAFEEDFNISLEDTECVERMKFVKRIELAESVDEVSSTLTLNIEPRFRRHDKEDGEFTNPRHEPTDATLDNAPFHVGNFFVSCASGAIALIQISQLKNRLISLNVGGAITSLDTHPVSNYIVTGNINGLICLYDYEKRKLMLHRKTPPLPDFYETLKEQMRLHNLNYISNPQTHKKFSTITVLKYSPLCDQLACGLENGTLWILHPITLEALDDIPYKHSSQSINQLVFTECAEYMAYSDNTLIVAVFKRNHDGTNGKGLWTFLGKYRSHCATIRDLLFGPILSNSTAPRLFSLGEDKMLIEYDLEKSGPYPDPGLLLSTVTKIEYKAIPLCLSWYPETGVERFLLTFNSEYKYRLLNDTTKMIRGTFLGPTFGTPIQHFQVLEHKEAKKGGKYMIFVTEKEIGIQMLPLDGNPYKILGITGHPVKITNMKINHDGTLLFTSGYNDPCVLVWKIKRTSVDVLAQLGGNSLLPYYSLIEGGKKGWLINEMKDLFYYAQILHQGENTTATRIVSDKVAIKEIPNLMCAIGFYPSKRQTSILLSEIAYKIYAKTGHLIEEITFEDFVKLYINHRPVFGISMNYLREAFEAFTGPSKSGLMNKRGQALTREQFLNILFGKGCEGIPMGDLEFFGEPLTEQEVYQHLKILIGFHDNSEAEQQNKSGETVDFSFLPERISYKDFAADIMGIELPEETRADN